MKRKFAVVMCLLALLTTLVVPAAASEDGLIHDIEDLRGKTIGLLTGVSNAMIESIYFDGDINIVYFNSDADMPLALKSGKIDAYMCNPYGARQHCRLYPELITLETPINSASCAFLLGKGSPLVDEVNEYLAQIHADGTYDEIYDIWFGDDDSRKVVDTDFTGENGTVTLGTSTSIGAPFAYMVDGQIAGLELDIAARFCRAYGYAIEFVDYGPDALPSALAAGKIDMIACSAIITDEVRSSDTFDCSSETIRMDFSAVVRAEDTPYAAGSKDETGFFASLAKSFRNTFLNEGRYQLFLVGIGRTLLITVLSILLGTLLGFGVYMLVRHGNPVAVTIERLFARLIHGMPIVVLLMILFYIIFGSSSIDGLWIAVIAFSLVFAVGFTAMLRSGTAAVGDGQAEAALALGYTEPQAFLRLILPQAAAHFMPTYKAEVTSLVKATAVVGYIAVQDLTKVSDVVRARTYEPFFPLIFTAILYFLMAAALNLVVELITRRLNTRRRGEKEILKGAVLK